MRAGESQAGDTGAAAGGGQLSLRSGQPESEPEEGRAWRGPRSLSGQVDGSRGLRAHAPLRQADISNPAAREQSLETAFVLRKCV